MLTQLHLSHLHHVSKHIFDIYYKPIYSGTLQNYRRTFILEIIVNIAPITYELHVNIHQLHTAKGVEMVIN